MTLPVPPNSYFPGNLDVLGYERGKMSLYTPELNIESEKGILNQRNKDTPSKMLVSKDLHFCGVLLFLLIPFSFSVSPIDLHRCLIR